MSKYLHTPRGELLYPPLQKIRKSGCVIIVKQIFKGVSNEIRYNRMPPRRRARFTRTQLHLRRLRREELRRRRSEAAANLRAAAECLAARRPRRSLRIKWRWYNAPYLVSGQAPWYRYVLFGEDEFAQVDFPPEGYRIAVGFDGDWLTDSDD